MIELYASLAPSDSFEAKRNFPVGSFVVFRWMPRPNSFLRTILQPMAVAVGLAVLARAAVHIYSIPSASMVPTLEIGDQILVTRYFASRPERGHVIVFRSPVRPGELMVKRVVGVPGDRIDSRLGRVRIAGHTLPEPYLSTVAASGAIESQIVPASSYFVMGDNRESSLDSRVWGVVPQARIVGRAQMVLWSAPHAFGGEVQASGGRNLPGARPRQVRFFKCVD
jgi:signal peptidase I